MNNTQQIGNGKTIVLLMPEEFSINDVIAEQLRYHGFDVIFIKKQKFKYHNIFERFENFFRKHILKDNDYKNRCQEKIQIQQVLDEIKQRNKKVDYALFIRADMFSIEHIQTIKSQVNYMVAYQWDGMSRFKGIDERIAYFDQAFLFDLNDLPAYPQMKFSSNFYFDMYPMAQKIVNQPPKIYYLGSHIDERVAPIVKLLQFLQQFEITQQIYIGNADTSSHKQQMYQDLKIDFIQQSVTFTQNIFNVQQADILVDFVSPVHKGLSFRIFEALYYQKKLITTNTDVVKYDFYHPDNIFMWNGVDFDEIALSEFLIKPYQTLDPQIVEYYSFKNWIKRLLDLE